MSPLDPTFAAGLPGTAAVWLVSAAIWGVATVFLDRDARLVFGSSRPWKHVMLGAGAVLLWGASSWGIRVLEPLGIFLLLVAAAYAAVRGARVGWLPDEGPWKSVVAVLRDVAKALGVDPRAPTAGPVGSRSGRDGESDSVVLLKKDGEMYGGDDDGMDREVSDAIRTVKEMVAGAVAARATDIHVEPRGGHEVHVRCRVDGLLQPLLTLTPSEGRAAISAIKVLSDMDIAERRRPQDGGFAVLAGGRRFDVRVNSGPTGFGEKVAMRLLDPAGAILREGLAGLGMRATVLKTLRSVIHRSHGMLIVCGPTGSGKTTTVYAALREIDGLVRNVVTIEDPIEYQLDNVSQTAVNTAAELTFATILRAVLRQDPDVILVGEIRDKETAEIAMQAALTGHFVFTTLHSNDAPTTVTRLLDIGIDASLIQSAVTAILAQRLVRALCPACRDAYQPTPEERKRYGLPAEAVKQLFRAKGCAACGHTGYRGRTGIYELLVVDGGVRELLVASPSVEKIRELAIRQGMRTLRQAALQKAAEGVTTLEEVDRVIADESVRGGQ